MKMPYRRRATLRIAALSLVLLALLAGGPAPRRPALATPSTQALSIALEPVAAALESPVAITHAGDGSGRLFITEQGGRIRIYDGTQLLEKPFLDISALVSGGYEQGLLSVAFHPDYETNGYFYVDYTDKNGDTVIARYKVSDSDPNVVSSEPPLTLLPIDQPQPNHNGGQLQFGPDGYLYIGMGDGGSSGDQGPGHNPDIGNGQDLSTLLGKMLRIDVNNANTGDGLPYDIPPGNPFVSTAGARDEIWSYGFRNPWRFSFDRQTGDVFIGDVGQGSREEVDFQPAGTAGINYGWRCMEGTRPFDTQTSICKTGTFTPPILEYDNPHDPSCGGAVTGGYIYRGARHPQLAGVYLYADFCTGQIWGATRSGSDWSEAQLLDTSYQISSFGEDRSGELYLADRSGGGIYRIAAADTTFVYLPVARR